MSAAGSGPKLLPEAMLPAWLHGFLMPLVAGGDVRVARPLGADELTRLADEATVSDADARVFALSEARQAVMAELIMEPRLPPLDDDALRLAVAVNNLLFLSHPATAGVTVRKRRLARLAEWSTQLVTEAAPSSDDDSAVYQAAARHSLLHHLFDLGRDDVRVSFWAGRREFHGSEPPARLYRWSGLRRVREERWRVDVVAEAVAKTEQAAIVQALLDASPLTALLTPLRAAPAFDLRCAAWLRYPTLARAVADAYLNQGLTAVAVPYTAALVTQLAGAAVALSAGRAATAVALRFLCHLHLLTLVGRREPASVDYLQSEIYSQSAANPTLKDFYALFAAAHEADAAAPDFPLGAPADLARDPRLRGRVDDYAAACKAVAGADRVAALTALLAPLTGRPDRIFAPPTLSTPTTT